MLYCVQVSFDAAPALQLFHTISQLTTLTSLSVTHGPTCVDGWHMLSANKQLQVLEVVFWGGGNLTVEELLALSTLPRLRCLRFRKGPIDMALTEALCHLTRLEVLDLVDLSMLKLQVLLERMPNLRSVYVNQLAKACAWGQKDYRVRVRSSSQLETGHSSGVGKLQDARIGYLV